MIRLIGERTVAQHLAAAAHKLGTGNQYAAALQALRLVWIT